MFGEGLILKVNLVKTYFKAIIEEGALFSFNYWRVGSDPESKPTQAYTTNLHC